MTIILVLIYAPVDSKNKPLNEREYKKYRKISIYIVFLQVVIISISYFLNNDLFFYCNIAAVAILIEGLTLINYNSTLKGCSYKI